MHVEMFGNLLEAVTWKNKTQLAGITLNN